MPRKRTPVQIDPEHCEAYLRARKARGEAEAEMANYKAMILEAMGDMTVHQTGPFKIHAGTYERRRLDEKGLKAEEPELYEAFTVTKVVSQFRIDADAVAMMDT